MSTTIAAVCQVLLSFTPSTTEPLRFGFPLPAKRLSRGLRVEGRKGARLQWRVLGRRADPITGHLWCELCVTGARGKTRVVARGKPAVGPSGGDVVRYESKRIETREQFHTVRRWRWHDGRVDEVRRITFRTRQSFALPDASPDVFHPGESVTLGDRSVRYAGAGIPAAEWRRVGILPPGGKLGRPTRRALLAALPRMVALEGRDRGDYRRGPMDHRILTNLEFDTALAFARLGLAEGRGELLKRAVRCARHSVDLDLDERSHLLFPHGVDHRSRQPDPGHTWLAGLLLAGCCAADDALVAAAGRIAHGLARHPPAGRGRSDRVRDIGWPLLEMETWLRFADDAEVDAAATGLVRQAMQRWDDRDGLFRFGEGVRSKGVYDAPLWVTSGSLLPGLRKHAQRTGDRSTREAVRKTQKRIVALCLNGKPGVPIRYVIRAGDIFREARTTGSPALSLVLEGLARAELRRCLGRRAVRSALSVAFSDESSIATDWTMVGRCEWIYR